MCKVLVSRQAILNVPNLRFPEFSGEWKKSILKAECEINPKTGPLADTFQYIDLESVVKGQLIKVNYLKKEDAPSRAQRVLSKWDILYQCVRPYQLNNFLVRDNSSTQRVASTGYAQIRTNNNPDFFFQLLHTQKFTGRVINRCTGTNYPAINSTDLSEIEINIPEIKEQEKIGRMLSLIDQRIAIQNRLIEKYESLIKGIVDITILGKEKNANIGDICSISKQIKVEANLNDIISVRLHGKGVCKSCAENLQIGSTQYYRRRTGQLIYGKQNFHNGAIGIVPESLDNGITSKDIPSFDIDRLKCNSLYLLAQLQSPQYYRQAEALTTGTGSKRLKEETFLKMPIVLPDKEEQDNIASLVSCVMTKLDLARRLLALFSCQKNYLLDQLFV